MLMDDHYIGDWTIAQSLQKLGPEIQRVYYVLNLFRGTLTVYKPPKGFTSIGDWVISRAEELKSQD